MLGEVLSHLRNWFVAPDGIHKDEYEIKNGGITLPFLVHGQYFRICGSMFNDGVYQYPAENLRTETFDGTIWSLRIPPEVVALSDEIAQWVEKNGDSSTIVSESFGGYSYQRATGENGKPLTWKNVFASRLNRWRKL